MEVMIDTANTDLIEKYNDIYDLAGVTCNPSILAKEKPDFYGILDRIRRIIGPDRSLHIQLTASTAEDMLREAETLTDRYGKEATYLKVPANETGIRVMKRLKQKGCRVTATAIYTSMQGMLAMSVGADCLAPYYNRMENNNYDPRKQISEMAYLIDRYHLPTKIVAASFRNPRQIMDAYMAGAQAVTASPELLTMMVNTPNVADALEKFSGDWRKNYGDKRIFEL